MVFTVSQAGKPL